MSALDVIDRVHARLYVLAQDNADVELCEQLERVRAAMAELIEAAEETVDDHDCGMVWGHQIEKLSAAIARAKGGAA